MALELKYSHNYLPYLVKHNKNTVFHSIIDTITSSKYHHILTVNAPIHLSTSREFWENAKFLLQNKKPYIITSTLSKEHVEITPKSISNMSRLQDWASMETFRKNDLQHEFIEGGHEVQMVGETLFKLKFPPEMKFFFHTFLVCFSIKTSTFNEIPLKFSVWVCYLEKLRLQTIPNTLYEFGSKHKCNQEGN
ncbi:hypothetical protein Hanom_Chr07g00644341 [Helianthus anomalus]